MIMPTPRAALEIMMTRNLGNVACVPTPLQLVFFRCYCCGIASMDSCIANGAAGAAPLKLNEVSRSNSKEAQLEERYLK